MSKPQTHRKVATADVAFTYRIPAGFAGDVNRNHPVSIEPALNDATHPVAGYGYPVLVNAAGNGVRGIIGTDTTLPNGVWGFAVRAFPIQPSTGGAYGAAGFDSAGVGVPPPNQPVDIMTEGYMMAKVYAGTPVKGTAVYVRAVIGGSSPAGVVVGGLEAANDASGGGAVTVAIPNAYWTGGADSNGFAEFKFRL